MTLEHELNALVDGLCKCKNVNETLAVLSRIGKIVKLMGPERFNAHARQRTLLRQTPNGTAQ
jgi:pentatricopeptide repeat protein